MLPSGFAGLSSVDSMPSSSLSARNSLSICAPMRLSGVITGEASTSRIHIAGRPPAS